MDALTPVFVVILLGHLAKRTHFLNDAFWFHAERGTYYLFLPALLVAKLAQADVGGGYLVPITVSMVGAILGSAVLLFVMQWLVREEGPAFSSVFQGGIRPNTYVGLAAAATLYGDAGLTISAIVLVGIIPAVNFLSVMVVSRYGHCNGAGGVRRLLLELARNPLILGCAAGFGLNLSGLVLPGSFYDVMEILGSAALPLALLDVGAGLRLRGLGSHKLPVIIGAVVKLIALPLIAGLGCTLFGLQGPPKTVLIIFATLPAATASYILARQLGGDEKLMAAIITVQTLAAFVTMPVMLVLLGG